MPDIELRIGLWNRNTQKKQWNTNPYRMKCLVEAVEACGFDQIAKPNQRIIGAFVAPEYYFAGYRAGQAAPPKVHDLTTDIGRLMAFLDTTPAPRFCDRCVTEEEKDHIVQELLVLSQRSPKVLMLPGTIAWSKSLNRSFSQEFKRDPKTQLRTDVMKSATSRKDKVLAQLQQSINLGGSQGGTNSQYTTPVPTQQQSYDAINAGTVTEVMKNTAYVFMNGKVRFKYNKRHDFHEALSDTGSKVFCPGVKSGYTTIAGIDMGFEICLDHVVGQLVSTTIPVGFTPKLHFVTSAHVPPSPSPVHLGGCYIHASSNHGSSGVWKRDIGGLNFQGPVEQTTVAGDPLDIYSVTITV